MENIGIFTEKFRPTKIEDLVLPDRIKQLFIDDKKVEQHYLFYSSKPGSGKSTIAKILADQDMYDDLYINVSDESSVETIRGKIKGFANGASIISGYYAEKLIILDEIHGASDQFFNALLGVTEQFANNVKFIATCNYINKIPENVRSRFECIHFAPVNEEEEKFLMKGLAKRTYSVAKQVGLKIEKDVLIELVKRNFPDMRSILSKLNYFYKVGKETITFEDVVQSSYTNVEIFELCANGKNYLQVYKQVINKYTGKSNEVIESLGNEFIIWMEEKYPEKLTDFMVPAILKIVRDASYKRNFVQDRVLNLAVCVFEIQEILNQSKNKEE